MDGQYGVIHGRTGLARGGERRIKRPATADSIGICRAFSEHRNQQKPEGRRQQPERNVVHAWKRHVGRADHQRHKPVSKAADHRGHDHEEDHEKAVARDKHVIHVLALVDCRIGGRAIGHLGQAGKHLNAGLSQFNTHHDGQKAANQA